MKRRLWVGIAIGLAIAAMGTVAYAATATSKSPVSEKQGLAIAKTVTTVTGIAISPLLGVGAVGAWDYFQTPSEKRDELPWYAYPSFWIPALLLVGAVAAKDSFGTVLPPGLKKPLDVAETVENKVSGMVAAGAVIPSIAAMFHSSASTAMNGAGMAGAGFAAIDFTPLLNILMIPLGVAAFVLVWLVAHVINVLILISPFGVVDAALKSLRTSVLGLLVLIHYINPWVGALLSLIIVVISYFLAGWSFRMMVFGSVFTWDFITRRRKRFQPAPNANWMFTARKLEKTPIRTYGKLIRAEDGKLTLEYRPWLVLAQRTVALPAGHYAVGRGLFYPEILMVDGEKTRALLTMPPRYKKHEEELGRIYAIGDLRDTGLLKGIKAIWRWWTTNLFGRESKEAAATAPA